MHRYHVIPKGFKGHDVPLVLDNDDLAIAYAAGFAYNIETEVSVYRTSEHGTVCVAKLSMDADRNHIVTTTYTGEIVAGPEPAPEPSINTERRMRFRGRGNGTS